MGGQQGGGNALQLDDDADDHDDADDADDDADDADDADDYNDDADGDIDRWQPSLTGCRYVNPSQDMTRLAFPPQRTKKTFSGESFFHSPKSLSCFENKYFLFSQIYLLF